MILAGLDIGGTKCAVSLGRLADEGIDIIAKRRFATPDTPAETIGRFLHELSDFATSQPVAAIGISCGGPLDSRRGIVLSPPNLPGWDEIDIVSPFRQQFNVPVAVQNDANAGALAEWQWGAGRGCQNMIFLTFGTGMGAGLVLDGRLYSGTNDLAGEVGHIRLADDGPVGFHKAGSFEGFCSGGGIARLAQQRVLEALQAGEAVSFCPSIEQLGGISAETVGHAAQAGDRLALEIYRTVAARLGQGLSLLIDILNPERIVIGSIFGRQRELIETRMWQVIREEAIPASAEVCEVVPTGLGERIGDYAALAVAKSLIGA